MKYLLLEPSEDAFYCFALTVVWHGRFMKDSNLVEESSRRQLIMSTLIVVYNFIGTNTSEFYCLPESPVKAGDLLFYKSAGVTGADGGAPRPAGKWRYR